MTVADIPNDARATLFWEAFISFGGDNTLGEAQLAYIIEALTEQQQSDRQVDVDLGEIAWSFESLGLEHARRGINERDLIAYFSRSFQARSSMGALGQELGIEDIWLLIASGVASQNHPQLRQLLRENIWVQALEAVTVQTWEDRLLLDSTKAVYYLCRKHGGWQDIDSALAALRSLVEAQAENESRLNEAGSLQDDASKSRLLGLYHLAEGLTVLGGYLRTGLPASAASTVERHAEHCRYLLGQCGRESLSRVGAAAALVLPLLIRSSIWHSTTRLSEAARKFAEALAGGDASTPVLELWWAQREALAHHLLDPYRVAVSVQMPTSAGKTLLAEFSIIQALALNPSKPVAYLVPTRALVNQITRRLKRDLLGARVENRPVRVESAVPVFELDPTEDHFLSHRPDVIVTTPEKLDLLVRAGHTCVQGLSLVVVDEAHHISEPSRGPRLELLLATLKRERGVTCRYLLLTPFLPNAEQLSQWLGDDAHAAIRLDWRPSLQVRAIGKWKKQRGKFRDTLQLVPAVTQPSVWSGVEIDLGETRSPAASRTRSQVSASLAVSLASKGSETLVLTRGAGTAERRALQIAEMMDEPQALSDDLSRVIDYVRGELGDSYPLLKTLRRRVAFHHAGMPPDVRALVELLIDRGDVKVVTGTTTLAQGVDFPLSAVIIEMLKVPQGRGKEYRALLYSEFWNIAGRAGRALRDRVGAVIWPIASTAEGRQFNEYLAGEASAVVSALADAVVALDDAASQYDLALVRNSPALSHFLQFLAHALRVGGYDRASAEVEDILRTSLVFHNLRQDDPDAAERLVRWSRGFFTANRDRQLLDVADATGLSLPSVGLLAGTATPEMQSPSFWNPDHLFGEDLAALTDIVSILAEVPEMSLGLTDQPGGLNAGRVAGLLRDWVNGETLPNMARKCFPARPLDEAVRDVGKYVFRDLTGQMPWGLGALQLVTMRESAGAGEADLTAARRVPAMAFYGVRSSGAVALRMVGVPRMAAEHLGNEAPSFDSFDDARAWLASRPSSSWTIAGEDSRVSGETLRRIWSLVAQ
ncbi:DEAD/DEAH box helicase [Micromonospora zamorensis]|uniref:DEAD/DEAH box helicase n=1 Tax=Micromonospora zamorensis TaxID=709883 RepID=UPI0033ACCF40